MKIKTQTNKGVGEPLGVTNPRIIYKAALETSEIRRSSKSGGVADMSDYYWSHVEGVNAI